ncbi:MAG: hypothetical protein R3E57_11215 [Porticoccaceae bacterium]
MSSILFEKKRANINGIGARLATILVGLCLSFFWQGQPFLQQQLASEALALHPWMPAAVFSAAVLLGSLLSIFFIRLGDWRRLTLIGGLVSGFAFAVPAFVPGATVLLVCLGLAGLFAGFGLSAAITCLGDTANPVGSFGGLLLLQALVAVGLESAEPALQQLGSFRNGLLVVAAVALLAIPFSRLMPSSGSKRVSLLNNSDSGLSAELLTALAGGALLFLAAGVLWYLSGPLADVQQLSIGAALMLVLLLARAAGGLVATLLGNRAGVVPPLVLAAVLVLIGLGLLQFLAGENGYLAAFALIGGAGFLAAAYVMGLIAHLDGSGRFAPLALAVPLFGLMVGHLVAGKLAGGQSPVVLWSAMAALWVVGTLLLLWAAKRR